MDAVSQSGLWSKIKPAKRNRQQQEATIRLLFLAPWLLGLILLKPLPILAALIFSVILPRSIPVVTTVALLHFFSIWSETRLSSRQMVSFGIQRSQTFFFNPKC
jgi:hypothetical protein